MKPIRAVCFDLDDTLLDYGEDAYRRTVTCVCDDLAAVYHEVDAATLLPRFWEINHERWSVEGAAGGAPHARDGYAFWRETWSLALAASRCREAAVADDALALYVRYRHEHYRLFDDAVPVLEALRGHYKLALITNGPGTTQRDKLRFMQLEPYFEFCAVSGEMGSNKPNAAIFEQTLGRLGVRADEALHVGDSLANDVGGALAAGLHAVWVNRSGVVRGSDAPVPHHDIALLTDLQPLIEAN